MRTKILGLSEFDLRALFRLHSALLTSHDYLFNHACQSSGQRLVIIAIEDYRTEFSSYKPTRHKHRRALREQPSHRWNSDNWCWKWYKKRWNRRRQLVGKHINTSHPNDENQIHTDITQNAVLETGANEVKTTFTMSVN